MATTSSRRHFDFEHPIFDFASSCPYLSPHDLIQDRQSHTVFPPSFPFCPHCAHVRLDARPPHTGTSRTLSSQVPLFYTVLTAAPLLQPEAATTLTGGEYPLPLACLCVLSPLSLTGRILAIVALQVERPGARKPPAHASAARAQHDKVALLVRVQICESILSPPSVLCCLFYLPDSILPNATLTHLPESPHRSLSRSRISQAVARSQ